MARKMIKAAAAVAAALTGGYLAEEKLYRSILKPKEHPEEADTLHAGVAEGRLYVREHPDKQDLYLRALDGLKLYAAYLPAAKEDCHTYVIMVHGHGDTHERVGIYAQQYHRSGYPVLMPDLRGYGRSEGTYVGFGYDDRLDLLEWIYYLIRMDEEAQIILHGISMGASAVMLATGETLPANVKAAIEDSGYSTLSDEFAWMYQRNGGGVVPSGIALKAIRQMILQRGGYDIKDVDCKRAVANSKTPTLFLHGEADITVPVKMCRELFKAAACPKKQMIFLNASHVGAVSTDAEKYWGAVDAFLSAHL